MNDPIKIIFKYKNNNRRTHYNIYIFVGEVPKKVNKILLEIQKLNLYECFSQLTNENMDILSDFYGEFWYKKFFNTYHINNIIDQILKNTTQQNELTKIRGKKWYDAHINSYSLVERRILYNYETVIKDDLLRKEHKKHRLSLMKEDPDALNFVEERKTKGEELSRIPKIKQNQTQSSDEILSETSMSSQLSDPFKILGKYKQNENLIGGKNKSNENKFADKIIVKMGTYNNKIAAKYVDGLNVADSDFETYSNKEVQDDIDNKNEEEDEKEELGTAEDELEDETYELEQDMELSELEKLYQDTDVDEDKNIAKTATLIKDAVDDDNIFKKIGKNIIHFDESKNNLMFDDTLKNVYYKNYVTSQYIFKDDSIKNIKNKICVSIKNSTIYGENSYIIPSRQYLWSEYIFNDKIDRVMIGQKWIRKSELLAIDTEINNNIRYYEELRGNLKLLRDTLKRYGNKIKREDDDNGILYDYDLYFTNNEIFMLDIYNDLGKNYNPDSESLKNITEVYRALYYPRIKPDNIKQIIEYLNNTNKIEEQRMQNTYDTILNDLIIENEIIKVVEATKILAKKSKMFKNPHITHSVIHINLKTVEQLQTSIDLYRIFSKFEINEEYPFIQYQTPTGQIIFKYSEKYMNDLSKDKQNIYILGKWFENAPYGISFKMRIDDSKSLNKYTAINLNDMGRIEYKIQWKEEDNATVEDIYKTYSYVKKLIKKVNNENNRIQFNIPYDEEFKYAFLNTIHQFELPEKYVVKHNDLSEFSRFFFPYIAVVIEPRKRMSKVSSTEMGKFGTYLRFKRVTKYENSLKIEQKILYFMRNYEYVEQSLIDVIVKQFNISVERATDEIEKVKNKYPHVKKSRNVLKKIDTYAKHKPPGIGIDIQGKQRDRYKVRVSGVRDVRQLDRIISFYETLLYLYYEIYLLKNPEYQEFKEKLEKLTSIAKRRNKVLEYVDYEKEEKKIKNMEQIDKSRIGFTPDKGQNQWSRSCQNSNILIRQPTQFIKLDDILNLGFKYNPKMSTYEKKIVRKTDNKKEEIIIRAVGLDTYDEYGNKTNAIYYSCDPKINGENIHIGFLSKSANPSGQCMPCCFKKDSLLSVNVDKVNNFKTCTTSQAVKPEKGPKIVGEKLYILQDSNKIPEGRLGFLPTYLNYYFNKLLNKNKKMRQNILVSCKDGYYFKYGVNQENQRFLNAVSTAIDTSIDDIINTIINKLENDKSDTLFTALNNGDIKTSFNTRENYINYIKNENDLSFDIINHIISILYNINIVGFKKEEIVINIALEKERKKDDFFMICQNPEESDNIINPKRNTIILIKENKTFYPIVFVTKINELTKDFNILKKFKYDEEKDNVPNHIYDFYKRNCTYHVIGKDLQFNAKELYNVLIKLNVKDYMPQYQFVDLRNKCKYIITNNGTIIGTKISGSIHNLRITRIIDDKLLSLNETIEKLNKLDSIIKGEIKVKPIGVYYNFKNKGVLTCIGIMTESENMVPIKQITISAEQLKKMNLISEYKQSYDFVDNELAKEKEYININIDDRINAVMLDRYNQESYELFRYHLSEYLSYPEHESLRKRIIKISDDKLLNKKEKRNKLKAILFREIDKHLSDLYTEIQTGGENTDDDIIDNNMIDNNIIDNDTNTTEVKSKTNNMKRIVLPVSKLPDLRNYVIKNDRELCRVNATKGECDKNKHCHWAYDECNLSLVREMIIIFVNKVSEEIVNGGHKFKEVLKIDKYYVADIVDYTVFEEVKGQKIINSSNRGINKILEEIFDKDNIPKIGKRRFKKIAPVNIQELNESHAIYDMGDYYTQEIINDNMTLMRAFVNGYMWLKHVYYDLDSRNFGYYNNSQTDLANYFMSNILDWLIDYNNQNLMRAEMGKHQDTTSTHFIREFINKITRGMETLTDGIAEYYILNKIHHIPIIIYDNYATILYIIDDKLIYDYNVDKDIKNEKYNKYMKNEFLKNCINIKYAKQSSVKLPLEVQVIYYK